MKPNEILLKGCEEIARHFPDFKATQKGRLLKKKSQDKNIEFEIYFDTSARNYSGSVSIIPITIKNFSVICSNFVKTIDH